MTASDPFWIDDEYDRENASDGTSRYGAYVRQAVFEPWADEDQPVELAVFAWRQATTPVMSPGYVRRHPRILAAQLERSDWDGSLLAMVNLVTAQPGPLQYLRCDDERGMWQDWPHEWSFASDRDIWHEPASEDLARSPYLLCSASLRFAVPSARLPEPAADLVSACQASVAEIVRQLNAIIRPVLDRIEGSAR